MTVQSHGSVCKPLRWELINKRMQEASLLCVVPRWFLRRVAGTCSLPLPTAATGLALCAAAQLGGGSGTGSPSERSLIRPQGLADTVFWSSRRLFWWEVLVPLLGLKEV